MALITKILEGIKKIFLFVSKEFFLIFIYVITSSVLALLFWVLIKYVFPNKNLYHNLLMELNNSEKLLLAFLFALSLLLTYLYRLLLAAVQSAVLK